MADLEFAINDGVATLTMNRPEARNALSMEMRSMLSDKLHDCESDPSVRCVVLKGKGDHFMAGGDVKSFQDIAGVTKEQAHKMFLHRIHDLHTIMYAMRRMPKPILASVSGAAAGAGVSIAMACDLVIAAESAFFTLAYVNIGTSPDGSSTYFLPKTVHLKKAMEMALLGDRYTAKQAQEMGMVNFVVPADQLAAETDKLATRLANGPTRAMGNAKRLLYASYENDFEKQLQMEAERFADSATGPDFMEGVMAFVQKRKPSFSGK